MTTLLLTQQRSFWPTLMLGVGSIATSGFGRYLGKNSVLSRCGMAIAGSAIPLLVRYFALTRRPAQGHSSPTKAV